MTTDRHPRESGGPASFEEQRDSRFRGNDELGMPMTGDGCRAEPMTEAHREPLRAACAEDKEIWRLWMLDFGSGGFDESFDRIAGLNWLRFVVFDGDELGGMSCFINPDPGRGVVEIGNTYYRPHLRGTGFNRRVKDMMLARAFDSGIRRVEFRVDKRNLRSQAAMKKLGRPRRRHARRPNHLDRPCPRHGALLDPQG
jgi:RimJ/RimL family protein N-acetyltransferase